MRIELNLTLRCNLACPNCNRCCNLFRTRTDDVSRQQIRAMVLDIKQYKQATGMRINRIKVVGGEPLLHPEWDWVIEKLSELVPDHCNKVKVDSNGTIKHEPVKNVVFAGRGIVRKEHLPYLWSPTDLGLPITPCSQPRICGFSLDSIGWLPCSPAIMIARSFGLEHLYRNKMPTQPWGLDELCKHCIHAAPEEFRQAHCKSLGSILESDQRPTESWVRALERYRQVWLSPKR